MSIRMQTERKKYLQATSFDQSVERQAGPSGLAVRVPSDVSIWPPAALFGAVYASAVVRHFGVGLTVILEKWGDVFHSRADEKRRRGQADINKENSEATRLQRFGRRDGGRGRHDLFTPHDVAMMYLFHAMEPEVVMAYLRGCEEMAAARERKGLKRR